MKGFLELVRALVAYKKYTVLSVLFHFLTALFTVVSIPFIIPFFQILFEVESKVLTAPTKIWDLDGWLSWQFADLISEQGRHGALFTICSALVVLFLLRNAFRYIASYFLIHARNGVLRDLRMDVYHGYQSLSLSDRKGMKKGQLLSMMSTDIVEIDHAMLKAIELIFKVPLIVIGSLIFMIWLSPQLTIVAILLVLITLLVIGRLSHVLKKSSSEAQHLLGEMNAVSDEYLSATKLIKTYGADDFFGGRFRQLNDRHFSLSNLMLRRRDLASPLSEFLAVCIITTLLWYGAHQVFSGGLQPASFFAFIFAFYSIVDPAKSFSREYYNVQKGQAALDRIHRFLDSVAPQTEDGAESNESSLSFSKAIVLDRVTFQFEDASTPIFKNLNLTIRKGEKIGIVGPSGVGKTSLFDLILGFYQPLEGEILIDGVPVEQYSSSDYRQLFGIVTQDSVMFSMSVQQNITLGDEEVGDAVLLGAHIDFAGERVDIGDQGMALSGGQRQRVSIARVLHHDREIVLLDEPTSALDSNAERHVLSAIYEMLADRTILMISHDERLLERMDRIIVLDGGQIVRSGTYEELFADKDDFFNTLN